jgi:glycosyltransferase involved in cell wall biosynthesis
MEQAICRNGLRAQWRWLGQRDDVVDLLHEHDLLVHPSYVEGLPNVVCEALACGCPVIVSDTLDHPRLVEDGVSGFVFDWHEPADLAAKIRQFQTLPETSKAEMGRRARQYAEHSLSLQRYVDDFEGMMSSLLGE